MNNNEQPPRIVFVFGGDYPTDAGQEFQILRRANQGKAYVESSTQKAERVFSMCAYRAHLYAVELTCGDTTLVRHGSIDLRNSGAKRSDLAVGAPKNVVLSAALFDEIKQAAGGCVLAHNEEVTCG